MSLTQQKIVVVGGGIVGWAAARHLTRLGHHIHVIDPPAAAAAHVAAGMLVPNGLSRSTGAAGTLNWHAREYWQREQGPLAGAMRPGGFLQTALAANADDWVVWASAAAAHADIEQIAPRKAAELAPWVRRLQWQSLEWIGWMPDAQSIDPADALAHLKLEALGHRTVVHHDPAVRVTEHPGHATVELRSGHAIQADRVIAATGVRALDLAGFSPPVRAVYGERVLLRAGGPLSGPVVGTPTGLIVPRRTPTVWAGVTVRDSHDGERQATPAWAAAQILSNVTAWSPALAQAEMIDVTTGARPVSHDGLPYVGAISPGSRIVVATGHGRDGILQSLLCADQIAAVIEGRPVPFGDLCDPARP